MNNLRSMKMINNNFEWSRFFWSQRFSCFPQHLVKYFFLFHHLLRSSIQPYIEVNVSVRGKIISSKQRLSRLSRYTKLFNIWHPHVVYCSLVKIKTDKIKPFVKLNLCRTLNLRKNIIITMAIETFIKYWFIQRISF